MKWGTIPHFNYKQLFHTIIYKPQSKQRLRDPSLHEVLIQQQPHQIYNIKISQNSSHRFFENNQNILISVFCLIMDFFTLKHVAFFKKT
jgi:hypothetical protein